MTATVCPECHGAGTITRVDYRYDPPVQMTACACRQSTATIPAPAWMPEPPTSPHICFVDEDVDEVFEATSLTAEDGGVEALVFALTGSQS